MVVTEVVRGEPTPIPPGSDAMGDGTVQALVPNEVGAAGCSHSGDSPSSSSGSESKNTRYICC